jgi:hypothetical protein
MIKKNTLFGRRKEMKTFLFAAASVLILTGIASAGATFKLPVSVPALMPWGMVGTAVALGLSGLYFIIKRRK